VEAAVAFASVVVADVLVGLAENIEEEYHDERNLNMAAPYCTLKSQCQDFQVPIWLAHLLLLSMALCTCHFCRSTILIRGNGRAPGTAAHLGHITCGTHVHDECSVGAECDILR